MITREYHPTELVHWYNKSQNSSVNTSGTNINENPMVNFIKEFENARGKLIKEITCEGLKITVHTAKNNKIEKNEINAPDDSWKNNFYSAVTEYATKGSIIDRKA